MENESMREFVREMRKQFPGEYVLLGHLKAPYVVIGHGPTTQEAFRDCYRKPAMRAQFLKDRRRSVQIMYIPPVGEKEQFEYLTLR